jgi:hypothetical protein
MASSSTDIPSPDTMIDVDMTPTVNIIQRKLSGKSENLNDPRIAPAIRPIITTDIAPPDGCDQNLSMFSRYLSPALSGVSTSCWTLRDEKIIRNFIQKAKGYRYLYNKTYFNYLWWHRFITYPLGASAVLLSGVQVLSAALFNPANSYQNQVFNIITTILTFITSTYLGFQLTFNYIGTANNCKDMASDFDSFQQELQLVLSLSRELRANPMYVINNAQMEYNKLAKNDDVTIPQKIIDEYVRRFKDKYTLVDIADDFDEFSDNKELYTQSLQKNNILRKFVDNIQMERYNVVDIDDDSI